MANELIIPIKYVFEDSDLTKAGAKIGALAKEEKKLESEMNDVAAAARKQTTEFNRAGDAGTKAARETEKQYSMLGNTMGSLSGMIAGAVIVDKLLSVGKQVLSVTAEFQRLKAVLASSLGSESAADRAFDRIADFAAKTPYSIQQITDSFVRMAGRGIQPTNDQLTSMGDTAAALGKDMGQLTEAILDVNNTERWTELGIKVKTEGDKISGTFRGMTVEVDKTEAGALKMVETFGKMEGVAGTMAKVSATLDGSLSNLNDTWNTLLATIGEKGSPIMQAGIKDVNGFLTVMNKLASGGYTAYGKELNETFELIGSGLDSLKSAGEAEAKIQSFKINMSVLRDELAPLRDRLKEVKEQLNDPKVYSQAAGSTTMLREESARLQTQIEKLKGQYDAYSKAIGVATDKQKELIKATEPKDEEKELGRIEKIRLKIKDITEERDKQVGLSQKQADAYNIELAILQEELDTLTRFKREKHELSKLDGEENGIVKTKSQEKLKILTDEAEEEKAIREKASRELYEELDARAAYERRLQEETVAFALFAAHSYATYQSDRTEERIRDLEDASNREQQMAGDNLEAKKKIEEEYNKRINAERVKQAKLEQNLALFQIATDTATSIIKTGAELGYPAAIPFQIMAGTVGAIQAMLVKSQPLPRYAKGTRSVTGGTPGEDSVLAMLMPGERVVTTEKNRQLSPALDILTDSKRPAQYWNKILPEIEKLGMFTPPKLHQIAGGGSNNGIDTDRIVAAVKGIVVERHSFDERGYRRSIEKGLSRIYDLNKHYGF